MKPDLWRDWIGQRAASSAAVQNFIYVHGIRDSPSTFSGLQGFLKRSFDDVKPPFTIFHHDFSYPWWEHMQSNGDALAKEIVNLGAPKRSVTLFGHSMGGLISRLAVLSDYRSEHGVAAHELIKRIVMFGTPNHGAVRAASLTLPLLWVVHKACSKLEGYYPRSPSMLELTDVPSVFGKPLQDRRDQANGIEYMTIPGTYFHENRQHLDFTDRSTMMMALGVVTTLLQCAYNPALPHDGIVERKSVRLNHGPKPGWRSEREEPSKPFADPDIDYADMQLVVCDRLDHLTVHQDKAIFEFVATLAFKDKLCSLQGTEYKGDLRMES
jgi:hypothetical protein